ncbi:signal peptidase II [Sinomonas sp. ASV486]|uniref:Lipoprotein signal peptidase n=1 Tax=Sinomonas puerhi TaxID=3238584 RepID=A0AB39L742_9MICC|nr:signal peptidase II [Sinomonas sp. ASV486]MDQ4489733.1 signal peptidase II [Sinomonas sp. ASV486]
MDTTPDAPEASPGRRRRAVVLLALIAVVAYIGDQLTKLWVTSTMVEGERIPVLPPLLQWYYIRNSGAAFSIGEGVTWVFTIVMTVVSVGIVIYSRKVRSLWWGVALGLVLGGALGNLTDRLLREPSFGMGHVVDFISLPNFAIFNVADSAVVCGVVLVCLLTLMGLSPDGTRQRRESTPPDGAPQDGASTEGEHD